ncbi:MAG: DUF371 domain-containing protein [Candidatus Thorarchaeota archaeon]
MTIIEEIYARGHENILCTHNTTIEITKTTTLSIQGDCVLAVESSKACYDINPQLKNKIKKGNRFKIVLKVGDLQDFFYGFGNKELRLLDKNDMVFRKSNFICDRTILINCSKSSKDLNRELIEKLTQPENKLILTFEVNE